MTDPTPPETKPKPIHTIVLDAGPILKNTPPLSTLLAQSTELLTTPSVVSEIRDPDARARVETMYLPFVKQRSPTPNSVAVLSEFARKTGDRSVLSRTDIEVLALAYEVECERNGGDWRLRSVPGQRRVNGKPPVKEGEGEGEVDKIAEELKNATLGNGEEVPEETDTPAEKSDIDSSSQQPQEEQDGSGSDSDGGWITPSNLKKKQARDEAVSQASAPETKTMQVATITTDFAVSFYPRCGVGQANCLVPKCPPSNESQSSINIHHAANPTPQVVHKTLPRLLLHHKRNVQAVLSTLWKRHTYPCVMHHRSQRPVQNASKEEHAMEQPRQPLQRPETCDWQCQWEMERRRRKRRMGN